MRDDYVDFLGDGLSGPEATKKLVGEWSESLKDPDEAPVFWLALAGTQWKYGRRSGKFYSNPERIEAGSDLARWDAGSKDYRKRRAVLDKLRAQLTSSQPPAKRVPKRFRSSNEWKAGELIGFRLLSGRFVVLRVIGHHTDKGGTSPICELLDWIGESLPNESRLKTVGIRQTNEARPVTQFMLGGIKAKENQMTACAALELARNPLKHPVDTQSCCGGGSTVY